MADGEDGAGVCGGVCVSVALAARVLPARGPGPDSDEARGEREDGTACAGERGAGALRCHEGGVSSPE